MKSNQAKFQPALSAKEFQMTDISGRIQMGCDAGIALTETQVNPK